MRTIGVYDSGIGGLTVLAEILKRFPGNAVFYFADNARAPYGALSDAALAEACADGLAYVQANSDVTVVACNTASTFLHSLARGTNYEDKSQNSAFILSNCDDKPSIKPIVGILPPLGAEDDAHPLEPYVPAKTLLLATEGTKRRAALPKGMRAAYTPELATLIERALDRGDDMDILLPYLIERLSEFAGVKHVILGCTHYPFCKKQIAQTLGRVRFLDGTRAVLCALDRFVSPHPNLSAPVNFAFSGEDESEKYSRVLELLVNGKRQI